MHDSPSILRALQRSAIHPAGILQQGIADQEGREDEAELGFVPVGLAHDFRRGYRDVDPINKIDHGAQGQNPDDIVANRPSHRMVPSDGSRESAPENPPQSPFYKGGGLS
jgi:hypothetical protein